MFLCCGDALFDMFADPASPMGTLRVEGRVGGSPLNVALGLARLGNASHYFTKLSSDMFGRRLAEFMDANRIGRSHCVPTERRTTLAMVGLKSDNSADYAFYIDGTADRSIETADLPATIDGGIGVLHVASYSTVTEPTASSLRALIEREKGKRFVSYDPNLRTMIEPDIDLWRETVAHITASADFVKASDEDLHQLYGDRPHERFAEDCIARGASLVCVTRGGDGALAWSADGSHAERPGVRVDVVDTVGAGDTFQAASLHWLANAGLTHCRRAAAADLDAMLDFAIRAAAITCSRRGADLPTLADIDNFRP